MSCVPDYVAFAQNGCREVLMCIECSTGSLLQTNWVSLVAALTFMAPATSIGKRRQGKKCLFSKRNWCSWKQVNISWAST